jgi:hypothetical protein
MPLKNIVCAFAIYGSEPWDGLLCAPPIARSLLGILNAPI